MKRILIVGAGGHAQVIADALASCTRAGDDYQLAGFLDDNPELIGREVLGARILGTLPQMAQFEHDAVVIGIGDNVTRARVFDRLKQAGETLISVVHPRATLAEDVVVGAGTVVMAGAVVNTGTIISDNVIVNTGATIDHHGYIGTHAHIAPGVHIGGTVTLGDGVFLGIGSTVLPNHTIGAWTVVGAGATVIDDMPAHVTAVGIPAHIIKTHSILD